MTRKRSVSLSPWERAGVREIEKEKNDTLFDFLSGYIGTVSGTTEHLSEDCGKHFTDGLVEKREDRVSWRQISLKYVARFAYGDTLPRAEDGTEGQVQVFGSNGPYATFSQANTQSPAIVIGRKGSYGKVNWTKEACFASDTTFFVDETTTQQHLRWLFYVLQTLDLDKGTDEAAVPGLNRDNAYERKILVPPLPEQHAIATYLDNETTKIDALIAEKERLLSLLAEKRRALITQAVIRGLNPDVPMRDSGVEWLGEIPGHWNVKRLKFLISGIDTGFSPQCHSLPAREGEWGVLKTGCVNGGAFNPQENKTLPDDIDPPLELEINTGDVLMSRASGSTDLIGSVALVRNQLQTRLLLSDKIFRLELQSQTCDANYFVILMGSLFVRQQILQIVSGAEGLANNITQTDIRELFLPLPPMEEQKDIASFVDQKIQTLNALSDTAAKAIEYLRERRVALISASVTGQIRIGVES